MEKKKEVRAKCPLCGATGIIEYSSEIKEEVALAQMQEWQAKHCKPNFIHPPHSALIVNQIKKI